jgi:uncharacterized CHY-type Zn-finger protein
MSEPAKNGDPIGLDSVTLEALDRLEACIKEGYRNGVICGQCRHLFAVPPEITEPVCPWCNIRLTVVFKLPEPDNGDSG